MTRLRLHNRVLPVLVAAAALAVPSSGFVTLAANRLVSGRPIGLFAAADPGLRATIALLGLLLLAIAFVPPGRSLHRLATAAAGVLLLAVLAAAGQAAAALAVGAPTLARVSLGAGFWILFGSAALAIVDGLQRAGTGQVEQAGVAVALVAAFAAMAEAGLFDGLSLAREYRANQSAFDAALIRHLLLVAGSVGPALLIGLPLGVAAVRRPGLQGPLFAVLNL